MNAVKAFEASARLESFSLAARELGVTPGAISQQVKILEDFFAAESRDLDDLDIIGCAGFRQSPLQPTQSANYRQGPRTDDVSGENAHDAVQVRVNVGIRHRSSMPGSQPAKSSTHPASLRHRITRVHDPAPSIARPRPAGLAEPRSGYRSE